MPQNSEFNVECQMKQPLRYENQAVEVLNEKKTDNNIFNIMSDRIKMNFS